MLTDSFDCRYAGLLSLFVIEQEWTNRSVRANVSTLVTLDTVVTVPHWNERSYSSFFRGCRTAVPSTVFTTTESRYGELISCLSIDYTYYIVHKVSVMLVTYFEFIRKVDPFGINFDLHHFCTAIYSCIVFIDHFFSLTSITLDDEFLHLFYSQVIWDYSGDFKEGRLQNSVGTIAQTDFHGDFCCINDEEAYLMLSHVFLHFHWNVVSHMFCIPR
ncbi:hypothetical protein PORCAN_496 [Porphyromonas crevioricanis JCM 13913]|nr:hypothetical protein PORCAN_496 [Porphyromonas crevioricanis JCM 13913]